MSRLTEFFVLEKKTIGKVGEKVDDDFCNLRPATACYPRDFAHISENFNVMIALMDGIEYSWIRVGGC